SVPLLAPAEREADGEQVARPRAPRLAAAPLGFFARQIACDHYGRGGGIADCLPRRAVRSTSDDRGRGRRGGPHRHLPPADSQSSQLTAAEDCLESWLREQLLGRF